MEDNIKLKNKLIALLTVSDPAIRHKTMLEASEQLNIPLPNVEDGFTQLWLEELDRRVKVIENPDLDFATRLLKKEAISQWLRNFISDKKDRENLINQKMLKDEPVKIYTLADLKAMRKIRRSKYYVTGLFQPGLYLVVAQAKTGKTLFGLSLGVSLLRGNKFLNRQVIKSNVLILQNEEEVSSTGAKIDNHGLQDFERENPEEYQQLINSHQLIVTRGLDICVDREKIMEIVDQYDIKCLIVDSFRASIAKSGLTEMDLGSAMALYQLQGEIHERGMLCLVIHHANKADNNDGQTNALKGVGGHNSLIGANDGIVKLLRNAEKKHDGRETIDVNFYPRNDTPSSFNICYKEKEACEWQFEVLDESVLSEWMLKAICDILVALDDPYQEWLENHADDDEPPVISGKDIDELMLDTNLQKHELVKVLNYLDHNEAVCRYSVKKKWIYHIPREGSDMFYLVEDQREKESEKQKMRELVEVVFAKILKTTTVEELDALSESLDDEVRVVVRTSPTPDVQRHISLLRDPPKFAVGDKVKFISADGSNVFSVTEVVFKADMIEKKKHRWQYQLKGVDDLAEAFELEKVEKNDVMPVVVDTVAEVVNVEVVEDDLAF
jgi:hypothetical protein